MAREAPPRRLMVLFNEAWSGWRPPVLPGTWEFSLDPRRLGEADVVVVHVPTLRGRWPRGRRPGQTWVAWSMESDVNYPVLADPAFMAQFDLTMTYRRDASVWCPYLDDLVRAEITTPPVAKSEPAPAVYFASNSRDRCGRARYAFELMRRLRVDSYGSSLTTRRLAEDRGHGTKLATIARYRFTLAFENSITEDYVTEKFFDPLIAGSVPVYRGAPNVADFAPGRRCFIDAADFDGPAALAAHLTRLAGDEAAYQDYLAWKAEPLAPRFIALLERARGNALSRLCELLDARTAASA